MYVHRHTAKTVKCRKGLAFPTFPEEKLSFHNIEISEYPVFIQGVGAKDSVEACK